MKAALFREFGGLDKLKIQEVDSPQVKQGHLLIKVEAAGLNPKDILIRKGMFKRLSGSKFPQVVGFDFSGTVVDSGESKKYKNGDEVFGMLNGWKGGTCAELLSISEAEVFNRPKNISFEESAGIPLAAQTALQALRDKAGLTAGQKVCINGASGGVGTFATQVAKVFSAEVTAICSHRNSELVQSLGADEVLDYTKVNVLDSEGKFDVFFDVFGNYSFKKVKHLLTNTGRYVTTVPKVEIFKEQFFNLFRIKKARIVVVKSNSKDLNWLKTQVESGAIKPIIDQVFPLEKIQEAQRLIESKRAKGKVIVRIAESQ